MKRKMYDDFKVEKPFGLHGLYKHISAFQGLNRSTSQTHIIGPTV